MIQQFGTGQGCPAGRGLIDWTRFGRDPQLGSFQPDHPMSSSESDQPWFRDGLSFECTRCGACCTGAPGYVWVHADEIARLAAYRKQTIDQFTRRFVRRVGDQYSLIEKPGGDCVFWDKQAGCTVYPARPVQCQTWPFWPENLESPGAWTEVTRVCPGSGQGQWFSLDEIRAAAAKVHS
jgi:Fe-S-cluster containining protein